MSRLNCLTLFLEEGQRIDLSKPLEISTDSGHEANSLEALDSSLGEVSDLIEPAGSHDLPR